MANGKRGEIGVVAVMFALLLAAGFWVVGQAGAQVSQDQINYEPLDRQIETLIDKFIDDFDQNLLNPKPEHELVALQSLYVWDVIEVLRGFMTDAVDPMLIYDQEIRAEKRKFADDARRMMRGKPDTDNFGYMTHYQTFKTLQALRPEVVSRP